MCSFFGFDPVFVFSLTTDRSCCGQIWVLRDCLCPEVCLICVCYIVICAPVKCANVISLNVNLPDESHLGLPLPHPIPPHAVLKQVGANEILCSRGTTMAGILPGSSSDPVRNSHMRLYQNTNGLLTVNNHG